VEVASLSRLLNRKNTSISGTLDILNFRQFSEQPVLPVEEYFATSCTKFICKKISKG
jgi:hypothetical protein